MPPIIFQSLKSPYFAAPGFIPWSGFRSHTHYCPSWASDFCPPDTNMESSKSGNVFCKASCTLFVLEIPGAMEPAGDAMACFEGIEFQSFVQARGKGMCLRPGPEHSKFLVHDGPGIVLHRAIHHRRIPPRLCGECPPVLHMLLPFPETRNASMQLALLIHKHSHIVNTLER